MAESITKRRKLALALFFFLLLGPAARGQDLAESEKRLTKFTLDNALMFLALERQEASVLSFHTYACYGYSPFCAWPDQTSGLSGDL